MKIKISDQSLRARITATEAVALTRDESVCAVLHLNAIDSFEILLRAWHLNIAEVQHEHNKLVLSIPLTAAQDLVSKTGYTYRAEVSEHRNAPLTIEVEIDLVKAKNP